MRLRGIGSTLFGVGLLLRVTWGAPAHAEEVRVLWAERDATLVESAAGALANGSGPGLFAGRTSQAGGSLRRAVLAFDVAGSIPAGARIVGVELWLELTPSHSEPVWVAVHELLADWGEGPSAASGGGGAPAQAGDSTWLHAVSPDLFWAQPGGDFARDPSAATLVGDVGPYRFSSPSLGADVQAWLDGESGEFGWILLGDETAASTAKRFASRESGDPSLPPALVVRFERPGGACAGRAPGASWGVCRAYCEALECDSGPERAESRACTVLALRYAAITGGLTPPCVESDADGDGVPDAFDVCPPRFDPDQADRDDDGLGDACGD